MFCLMNGRSLKQSDDAAPAADASAASTNEVAAAESVASTNAVLAEVMAQADSVAASASDSLPTASHMPPPSVPEKTVVLENDCLTIRVFLCRKPEHGNDIRYWVRSRSFIKCVHFCQCLFICQADIPQQFFLRELLYRFFHTCDKSMDEVFTEPIFSVFAAEDQASVLLRDLYPQG